MKGFILNVFKHVPKVIWSLFTGAFLLPVIGNIVVQIVTGQKISLSLTNLKYVALFLVFLLLLSFCIGAYRLISELQNAKTEENYYSPPKKLSNSNVEIGVYKRADIEVPILARIVLNENFTPSVGVFLDRIKKGDVYCPKCSRPMDRWNANWKADFLQIGYKCENCLIEHKGDYDAVTKDIKGEVKRNFESYWEIYTKEINKLTGGKPENFQLPD